MESSTLRRSTTEAKVAGVCLAFADRWRVDPLLVRVVAVLLALSGGLGLVLYAAAWVTIPRAGSDRAPIDGPLPAARRAPKVVWIIVIALTALAASIMLGGVLPFGLAPAFVVAGVSYLGLQHSGRLHQHGSGSARGPHPHSSRTSSCTCTSPGTRTCA